MKYIISEQQSDKVVERLTKNIKSDGWKKTARIVGGDENLIKILGITSPMEFLHLYDGMDVVNGEERKNFLLFRYNKGHNLILLEKKYGSTYISEPDIVSILEFVFGLNYDDIEKLINVWLDEVYDLRSIIPNLYLFRMDSSSALMSTI